MNIPVYVLTVTILNIILYWLLSFVQLSIDPSTWSEAARMYFAVLSGLSFLVSLLPSIKG